MNSSRRVAVVSEHLGGVMDEGVRAFATSLLDGFRAHGDAFGIATTGNEDTWHPMVRHISSNRLFAGRALRDELADIDPQLVVYIPSASGSAFAFWRATMLKRYAPGARVALVAVHARYHSALGRLVISEMGPDKVFAQSRDMIRYMEWLGKPAQFVPAGVDLNRFRPVSVNKKQDLRDKHSLPQDEYLVLHVGELKPGRNLEFLVSCAEFSKPVIVCGQSPDLDLWQKLIEAGVTVVDRHLREIEEIYQTCDAYVFPSRESDPAMDFPLSVLEAMACDLPVVTYPVGGLAMTFEAGDGLFFAESDEEMLNALVSARGMTAGTRARAEPYAWENVAGRMLEVMGLVDASTPVGLDATRP